MRPRRTVRDVVNYLLPAAALVFTALVLDIPVPIGLGLSLLVYAGLYLILNRRTETEEGRFELRVDAEAKLEGCRAAVARLRALAAETDRAQVAERVSRICGRAEHIIATLARRDLSLASATRLASVFEIAARTLDTYVHLVRDTHLVRDARPSLPQELRTVVDAVERAGHLFDQLESELDQCASTVVRDELVEIDAAIRTLERTLQIEGLA
jgi:hypothetical protein